MPIVEVSPYTTPILVYDAPVDEKTKKLREAFKVDEKTGYPEHYNWRPMARLGTHYLPKDPFLKFDPYDPKEYISSQVTIVACFTGLSAIMHVFKNYSFGYPMASRPFPFIGSSIFFSALGLLYLDYANTKQGIRNKAVIDYTSAHPERFGPIHRPKMREVLFEWVPIR